MSNYVLALKWERCPDGAHISSVGNYIDAIRYNSERRDPYSRRLEVADELIVTSFLNTWSLDDQDEEEAAETSLSFVDEYGLPFEDKFGAVDWSTFQKARTRLWRVWKAYEAGDQNDTVAEFRGAFGKVPTSVSDDDPLGMSSTRLRGGELRPDLQFRDGTLALTLQASTLYSFMVMETALVISSGSQVLRCELCRNVFVTGTGTGRRNTSRYCSARCRVAAQRAR